ncbi:MAG: hypothetical protein ACRDT9_00170 [Agromyces sp.]
MTEYTPTTERVFAAYVDDRLADDVLNGVKSDPAEIRAEFDRWLAQVKADAAAEARERFRANLMEFVGDDGTVDQHVVATLQPRADREPEPAAGTKCECYVTDPSTWFRYGSAVEPGSQMEPNPDCPVHFPAPATEEGGDHG